MLHKFWHHFLLSDCERTYTFFLQDSTTHIVKYSMHCVESFSGDRIISMGLWPGLFTRPEPVGIRTLEGMLKNEVHSNNPCTEDGLKESTLMWGTRWCSWFRHCALSWKVMGSIPNGVIGIFIELILSATLWAWG
jgi:hypothetical protein